MKHILTQGLHLHHTQVMHISAVSLRPQSHIGEQKSIQTTEGSSLHHNVTTPEIIKVVNILKCS
jgi:hypothetical protein